jgi:predicted RNase H-like HicB family nuclease
MPSEIGIKEIEFIEFILMRYAIVIENAGGNYSAYVPDLPGCIATGETLPAAEQAIREAIEFHLDGLREDGNPIPPPSSHVEYVEVAA